MSVIVPSRPGNQGDGRWNLSLPKKLPHYLIEIGIQSPPACLSRFFLPHLLNYHQLFVFEMRASSRTTHLLSLFVLPMQSRLRNRVYISRNTLVLGEKEEGNKVALQVEFERGVGLKTRGRTSYERELSQGKGTRKFRTLWGQIFIFSSTVLAEPSD